MFPLLIARLVPPAVARRATALLLSAAVPGLLVGAEAAAQQGSPKASAQPTGASSAPSTGGTTKRPAARPRLTPKQRIEAEVRAAAQHVRSAMVVQDTATLARLWVEEYVFTAPSGETYSKYERLETVMSPAFLVDEAAEVLPSELEIVRVYGNVAVVQTRLAPPGTKSSGSRGGRAQLLTVWLRSGGRWKTVASQVTAVALPPKPSKKKR